MRKFGTIYEVEVNGVRLCRKDGAPRRFGSFNAAYEAGWRAEEITKAQEG